MATVDPDRYCGKALTSGATELTAERLQVFEIFCERADYA